MKTQPILETERLFLTVFTEGDVPEVARLAGDRSIADTTLNLPHPYAEEDARAWIATHEPRYREGKGVTFAIRLRDSTLVGAIGLERNRPMRHAELGYWVGVEHQNRGYATEAARRLVRWAFEDLDLLRVFARHLARNPASGRVMEKLGMRKEGVLRRHILKWGVPEDVVIRALLREEFE